MGYDFFETQATPLHIICIYTVEYCAKTATDAYSILWYPVCGILCKVP